MKVVELIGGLAIVALILNDVFQSVIVPRATGRSFRISPLVTRSLWGAYRSIALRIGDTDRREDFLGSCAPLALVSYLLVWVLALILGYGLALHALGETIRPHPSFGDALYFAGTSFLTIGYGDIVAVAPVSRLVALAAGASGLAVVAVVTTFLFAVFGAFQRREVFVVMLGIRAGAPHSGIALLETYARLKIHDGLDGVFLEGQRWATEVLESHLAYPILNFFRSSHDYESWIAALGALLDAATLSLTTLEGGTAGQATMMYEAGRHLTHDLAGFFGLESGDAVGVERDEFDEVRARLIAAGYAVRESEPAWEAFQTLRAAYARPLNEMARYWRIPPAQWVGDRSLLPVVHGGMPAVVIAGPPH